MQKKEHYRPLLQAQYTKDLLVQMKMNSEVRRKKNEDERLLNQLQTLTQWDGDNNLSTTKCDVQR